MTLFFVLDSRSARKFEDIPEDPTQPLVSTRQLNRYTDSRGNSGSVASSDPELFTESVDIEEEQGTTTVRVMQPAANKVRSRVVIGALLGFVRSNEVVRAGLPQIGEGQSFYDYVAELNDGPTPTGWVQTPA